MLLSLGQLLAVFAVLIIIIIAFYLWMKDVPMFMDTSDLTGKTCIVTGANAGIGFTTAEEFAKRNARVILACRSRERALAAREAIIQTTGNNNIVVKELDLTSLSSIRRFAEEISASEERIDILVNNAGVLGLPYQLTADGLETNFATNHFGPFLLTNLLLEYLKKEHYVFFILANEIHPCWSEPDKLKLSAPSRIINVSSVVQRMGNLDFDNLRAEKDFNVGKIYFNSKLANVLFTRELAKRLQDTEVTVYCLHPGSVQTDFLNNMPAYIRLPFKAFRIFLRTPLEGVQTILYCALAEEVPGLSGKYFAECRLAEEKVNPQANDPVICKKLWDISCQFTGLLPDEST